MSRALAGLALLLALLLPGALQAKTLAVTFFDNNTTDPQFEPLGRGLASMLITDLSTLENLQVVERSRISEILAEVEFQKSPYVDKDTAVKMGRGLGAQWVLTGALIAVQPNMRLDARLVEVSTGKVLEAEAVAGPVEEFFLLEKELAAAILDKLEIRASARESARMGRVATESFDAFFAWSKGLEALDRGAIEDARRALEAALEHDDRFGLATSMLEDLRARLKTLDSARAAASDKQTAAILARIEELKAAGGPYDVLQMELVPASNVLSQPSNARAATTVGSAIMDLGLPEELRLGGPQGVYSLNEWAMYSYTMAQQWLGRRSDYITYGNVFLERYPASVMAPSFAAGLQGLLSIMEAEDKGRAEIPRVRAEALADAHATRCRGLRSPSERLAACHAWVAAAEAANLEFGDDEEEAWARAAEDAADIPELERILARAKARDQYGEGAEDVAKLLHRAQRDLESAAKVPGLIEKADDAGDYRRAVRKLREVARFEEGTALLEEALAKYPEDAGDTYEELVDLALDAGDKEAAEATLARWEKAAAASANIDVDAATARRVKSWDEDYKWVAQADSMALMKLATGLYKIGQHKESAEAWLLLAQEHGGYDGDSAETAYTSAANMFYTGWYMQEARAVYLELMERYPESDYVRTAQQMLTLLPE